jgi:hypothetical protein
LPVELRLLFLDSTSQEDKYQEAYVVLSSKTQAKISVAELAAIGGNSEPLVQLFRDKNINERSVNRKEELPIGVRNWDGNIGNVLFVTVRENENGVYKIVNFIDRGSPPED